MSVWLHSEIKSCSNTISRSHPSGGAVCISGKCSPLKSRTLCTFRACSCISSFWKGVLWPIWALQGLFPGLGNFYQFRITKRKAFFFWKADRKTSNFEVHGGLAPLPPPSDTHGCDWSWTYSRSHEARMWNVYLHPWSLLWFPCFRRFKDKLKIADVLEFRNLINKRCVLN